MNILLLAPDAWPLEDEWLDAQTHHIDRLKCPLTELARAAPTRHPDLVMVSGFAADAHLVRALGALCQALPLASVVVHQPQVTPQQLVDLMRAGVRDVLADCQPRTVRDVVDRALQRLQRREPLRSRVTAVITAKGGDGGSCVTANLAQALADSSGVRVLAMDLNLPFGDLAMQLSRQADMKDLFDVSTETDRMDRTLLESLVHHVCDNLHLLASPASFDKVVRIQPGQVQQLVDVAASHYHHVVMDLGAALGPLPLSVLDQADEICLVVGPSLPSVRRAGRVLELLQSLDLAQEKISLIVNALDRGSALSRPDIEKTLARPLRCVLPREEAGMDQSLLKGRTVVDLMPACAFSRAMQAWAAHITGVSPPKASLWQRLRIK